MIALNRACKECCSSCAELFSTIGGAKVKADGGASECSRETYVRRGSMGYKKSELLPENRTVT